MDSLFICLKELGAYRTYFFLVVGALTAATKNFLLNLRLNMI